MGKVAERRRRKKGRPSLLDLQKRTLKKQQQREELQEDRNYRDKRNGSPNYRISSLNPIRSRRSTRFSNDYIDFTPHTPRDDDDSECKRKKKLNLVRRLPSQGSSLSYDSLNSGSCEFDSHLEDESVSPKSKKRKLDTIDNGSGRTNSGKEEEEPISCSDVGGCHGNGGTQLDSGLSTSTPLPDKKLLLFILDRLQKKDTFGVFSEPVDPNELPDYLEAIECPMDFGTVRKKLSCGAYANLEQLEKDVFLIASNAMQYNASDTVYFRQARAIRELARKDFENLRRGSDQNEAEPKVVRRGRPPKHVKRPVDQHRVLEETGYNLRNGCLFDQNEPAGPSNRAFSQGYGNWMREGSIYHSKFSRNGKKQIVVDGNRRDTYRQPKGGGMFDGERKQLLDVGLHWEFAYARSLARFAAKLGHTAWRIASQKIERSLPTGVKFGRGWIGENEDVPSTYTSHSLPQNMDPSKLELKRNDFSERRNDENAPDRTSCSLLRLSSDSTAMDGINGIKNLTQRGSGMLSEPPGIAKSPHKTPNSHIFTSLNTQEANVCESSRKVSSTGRFSSVDSERSTAENDGFTPPDMNDMLHLHAPPPSSLQVDPTQPDLALQL